MGRFLGLMVNQPRNIGKSQANESPWLSHGTTPDVLLFPYTDVYTPEHKHALMYTCTYIYTKHKLIKPKITLDKPREYIRGVIGKDKCERFWKEICEKLNQRCFL